MKHITIEEAKIKATTYCYKSEKCIAEVREKLYAWGITNNRDSELIINFLLEENFINEERYANAYVRDKFRFNKWGRKKISMMLYSKQIDNVTIREALTEIDEEEYLSTLKELLEAKATKISATSEYEKQSKLFKFALSRGFESAIISRLI
ncbi:MAG: regulatory protein RecX [bacterium]